MTISKKLNEIYGECLGRYEGGKEKYGEFKPVEDDRDLFQETIDELLDSINYMAMQVIKLRRLRG